MWANKGSASSASFSDIEFRELFWWVERRRGGGEVAAVQWEPTGRSNGAVPLGCSVDNSDRPVTTARGSRTPEQSPLQMTRKNISRWTHF